MTRAADFRPRGVRQLRRGRRSVPNHVYHVTTSTMNRNPVLSDFVSGRLVVDTIRRESAAGRCKTLCFVVMPDHLQWLVQIGVDDALSDCVRRVKSHSARRINQRNNTTGRIWQVGFHDHAMRRDEDLRAAARYIIANPVRAGVVRRAGDYPLWDAIWL